MLAFERLQLNFVFIEFIVFGYHFDMHLLHNIGVQKCNVVI